MINKIKKIFYNLTSLVLVMLLVAISTGPISVAQAASLSSLSDTMSSAKVNATSSHALKFTTPSGAACTSSEVLPPCTA